MPALDPQLRALLTSLRRRVRRYIVADSLLALAAAILAAFWIGLLIVFEAAVGVLVLSGGRRTQLGYAAVLAFYLALTLFGGFELAWFAVMLAPMVLLLRAERRAATHPPAVTRVAQEPLAGIRS
jgi:uncharacterized RDD family membrane protein YckC